MLLYIINKFKGKVQTAIISPELLANKKDIEINIIQWKPINIHYVDMKKTTNNNSKISV